MPGFHPFGSVTGRASATLFEIRLENDFIVLRGGENEASSGILRGVVVLCLPALLKVEDVHLRMTGQLKVGWNDQKITPSGVYNNRTEKIMQIFNHKWPPFVSGGSSSKGILLPAENYEWPFEVLIPGTMAESVEGTLDSHIVYKLKATVARGKLAYDLHAWKPVRIVRTLHPSSDLDLYHAMTVENIWPNKIEYQLVIPQKAIIFGTAIDLQMRFTSLLKGLKIGPIKCTLVETHEFLLSNASSCGERSYKGSKDVEVREFHLNEEEHYRDMLDENGQDGWVVNETIPLPKRLARCLQDVEVHGIRIRHKVKFKVSLHSPDGHVSELRATMPVVIFISPNMPISERGELVNQARSGSQALEDIASAPPVYGQHILDQLYAGIDQTGLMTPNPQSGMNTPFYNHSRSGSTENLASLNGAMEGAIPPGALSSRLQNLNSLSRNNSFMRRHSAIESGGGTPTREEPLGGSEPHLSAPRINLNSSDEDDPQRTMSTLTGGRQTPEHIDHLDLATLSKVPSYTTAVKTPPPPRNLGFNDAVPDYDTAISAPPSPNRRRSAPVSSIEESNEEESINEGRSSSSVSDVGLTPLNPYAPL